MRIVVTGAAGFIGSHLAHRLVRDGHDVLGVDSFVPYYSRELKRRNIDYVGDAGAWQFEERLAGSITPTQLQAVDAIVHLAAQPGVRSSWDDFALYSDLNLNETNKLAAAATAAGVPRVVFASSSSVYGNSSRYPTHETAELAPRSPYGVTKQAGEALWNAHAAHPGLSVAALRFFTVYGPGQRPDMALQRLISAALNGDDFALYGDGEQRRDFTFVADAVEACVLACSAQLPAGVVSVNVGGRGDVSLNDLIGLVEGATGRAIRMTRMPAQRGDVLRTGADTNRAAELLGWSAQRELPEGISRQVEFVRAPNAATWASS